MKKQTELLLFSEQENRDGDSLFLGPVVYKSKAAQHLFSTDARVKLLSLAASSYLPAKLPNTLHQSQKYHQGHFLYYSI